MIRVVSVFRERLSELVGTEYGDDEAVREGFPDHTGEQFVEMFCDSHEGCCADTIVTRIEFEHLCPNRATFEDAGADGRGVDLYRCVRCNAVVPSDETDHVEGAQP